MGIIVVALGLAVPAIRALTGSNSEQAAQNTVSAFLAQTRTEAIGLQKVEGVLFYIDPATDRVTLAQVWDTGYQSGDQSGVTYLDLIPDHDTLALPPGIRLWTLKDVPPPGVQDPFEKDSQNPVFRYLGYNDNAINPSENYSNNDVALGGVVLFDGQGRLYVTPYGFRFRNQPTTGTATITPLGILAFAPEYQANSSFLPTSNWPNKANLYLRSQIAFCLFNRESFLNYTDSTGVHTSEGNVAGTDQASTGYIDANTTPILINRYNGTLIRAE